MDSKRDILLSVINHQTNIVPSWTMAFFDLPLAQRLLGPENVMTDYEPEENYKFGATSQENRIRNIKYSEATDNFAIGVGRGANFAFGHGGPGEFMDRIIERGDDYYLSQFETGVKKKVKFNPHFYHHYDYPLDSLDNLAEIQFPNANDERRYKGIKDEVEFYKARGYFTYANLNGFFSGLHYFCYPYDRLFMDMMLNQERLQELLSKLAEFNLTAAENLLKRGVDCITFCDDLGDGRSLLFSPELYRELFFPYHRELAVLCHSYGAYAHLHSHGNILKIFPMLVETGIDLINPCDPYEGMDLQYLKENYGAKVTLVGGMDKFFFEWDREQMKEFLARTIRIGRKNGGYLLMDSGGIPENVSNDQYDYYRQISKELRYSK